jgi:SAM-dependent methyltransferase
MNESEERFLLIGDTLVRDLRDLAGMAGDDDVLDIGCGYGRLAHALLRDAHFSGTYVGMDILNRQIRWCRRHLAGQRVSFFYLDVRNERYNPRGKINPTNLRLPVDPASADVVVVTSVFTHMWAAEIRHYLRLVQEALRPGGAAFATFFLLNDSWRDLNAAGKATRFPLPHSVGNFARVAKREDPLHVIAYEQDWVMQEIRCAGLVPERVELGPWCGRPGSRQFQDTVIARRPALPEGA